MRFIPKKLKNGYYSIENELGETLKRKSDFKTMLFEFRASAVMTAKRLKLGGLEKDLIF